MLTLSQSQITTKVTLLTVTGTAKEAIAQSLGIRSDFIGCFERIEHLFNGSLDFFHFDWLMVALFCVIY